MTPTQRENINDWLSRNILTLITVCVLLGGWITNYAIMGKRVEAVEQKQSDITARFDREVVPRREHEARDHALDSRLDEMQTVLNDIRREQLRLQGRR